MFYVPALAICHSINKFKMVGDLISVLSVTIIANEVYAYDDKFEQEGFVSHVHCTDFGLLVISNVHTSVHTWSQVELSVSPEGSQLIYVIMSFRNHFDVVNFNTPPEQWELSLSFPNKLNPVEIWKASSRLVLQCLGNLHQ